MPAANSHLPSMPASHRKAILALCAAIVMVSLNSPFVHAGEGETAGADIRQMEAILASLRDRLGITHDVKIVLVPANPLMMSVEAPATADGAFLLSIEADFLKVLSPDELEAALAHELGHVWVFTHHPYLQTEELANRIAMRVVTRTTLERVYEKVWMRGGSKGDVIRFLGDKAPVEVTPAVARDETPTVGTH